MVRVVGIDLGTTYSAVAFINDLGKPEILMNREGENITPSVVLFQGDLPIVGTMAKRSAVGAPLDVVSFVKRYMADPTWKFETTSGQTFSAEEISAFILKRLKEDAELVLGEGSVTDAVITVPAYFDDTRRRATMDAGRMAGLNVRRVLNEPTAAALAYGLDSDGGTVLVYDLGGGTFDVTLMRIGTGIFDVIATDGDRNLGGFDWDNELMNWLNDQFMSAGGGDLTDDPSAEEDLREKAEMAKRSLTTVAKTNVVLSHNGVSKVIPLTREHFNELTEHLLSRSRDLMESVLEEAGVGWSGVDRVLLVGGSTRMPMVREMVERLAGKPAERTINPDEVVALGAAVQAYLSEVESGSTETMPELFGGQVPQVLDVTSQGLGTLAQKAPGGPEMENIIIIPRNTKIPCQMSNVFSTVVDQQTEIRVEVTQGDDADPDYVLLVGESVLKIPPYPRGAPIEVIFSYDIDQTVHIEVIDLTSKSSLGTFEVDAPSNLSEAEVTAASVKIQTTEVG